MPLLTTLARVVIGSLVALSVAAIVAATVVTAQPGVETAAATKAHDSSRVSGSSNNPRIETPVTPPDSPANQDRPAATLPAPAPAPGSPGALAQAFAQKLIDEDPGAVNLGPGGPDLFMAEAESATSEQVVVDSVDVPANGMTRVHITVTLRWASPTDGVAISAQRTTMYTIDVVGGSVVGWS